jgi:hypothetical protein
MKEGEPPVLPNSSSLTKLLVDAHIEELRRAAARSRTVRAARDDSRAPNRTLELPITIRAARPADATALRQLAEYDSAAVPSVPVLIAEANGELRAAVSLHDGVAIAHPQHHTAWMVQLLHARAAQLCARPLGQRRLFRLRRRRWAM